MAGDAATTNAQAAQPCLKPRLQVVRVCAHPASYSQQQNTHRKRRQRPPQLLSCSSPPPRVVLHDAAAALQRAGAALVQRRVRALAPRTDLTRASARRSRGVRRWHRRWCVRRRRGSALGHKVGQLRRRQRTVVHRHASHHHHVPDFRMRPNVNGAPAPISRVTAPPTLHTPSGTSRSSSSTNVSPSSTCSACGSTACPAPLLTRNDPAPYPVPLEPVLQLVHAARIRVRAGRLRAVRDCALRFFEARS